MRRDGGDPWESDASTTCSYWVGVEGLAGAVDGGLDWDYDVCVWLSVDFD